MIKQVQFEWYFVFIHSQGGTV